MEEKKTKPRSELGPTTGVEKEIERLKK